MKKKSRLQLLHQYYSYTGFYGFLGSSLLKAIPLIVLFIGGLLAIHFYVIDVNVLLSKMTETFPAFGILSVFFISESILGLIPPEIFIAWSSKSATPIFHLSLLALLSYAGGVVSYFIGKAITKIPSVTEYLEVKMAKHIRNTRKWGGFLIIVGALLPIPYSLTTMTAGIINYPLKSLLFFGTLRLLRFYIYALAIFNIVS
ncbi:MAG: short-chain dehydrogenase [Flavobacteriaceae bacterium CG_4_8_14_3_um_filter_34_10]|nr:short-chain dehydrogenase [Flavobacteriia bacterium]OIP52316.1 MAG: short-chain dehydrogenase [Flavobacteriaceae bacterium CG2_30_34_30]PIQ17769.1 MAG: short-chain dehydrogenase [Flavobacteriaceae bacterium CG18_big_fil_WC_8_21_14_2_50_34_36]PIV50172.1 MAG: short-chain dehydrogenase [Flavobacteriaceae bacterium CG02_land_8_20_14_3_00_34_13]PIX09014.1 MAG: short-chain dehydrogenase [Flavobacteriaceae bacterium CG_4_8_14_3_um_filter_34_10]PIZ08850.1 MAG: short-chain dehydrogenase [Flavobacter